MDILLHKYFTCLYKEYKVNQFLFKAYEVLIVIFLLNKYCSQTILWKANFDKNILL